MGRAEGSFAARVDPVVRVVSEGVGLIESAEEERREEGRIKKRHYTYIPTNTCTQNLCYTRTYICSCS